MSLLLAEYDEEVVPEELADLGSFNHGYVQGRLVVIFSKMSQFTVIPELSLATTALEGSEWHERFRHSIKPDLSIYHRRPINFFRDTIRMEEMPLLAIEILSPTQSHHYLLEKMEVYFALGIKSGWLINPVSQTVTVFSDAFAAQTFIEDSVIDTKLDLAVPVRDIFG